LVGTLVVDDAPPRTRDLPDHQPDRTIAASIVLYVSLGIIFAATIWPWKAFTIRWMCLMIQRRAVKKA